MPAMASSWCVHREWTDKKAGRWTAEQSGCGRRSRLYFAHFRGRSEGRTAAFSDPMHIILSHIENQKGRARNKNFLKNGPLTLTSYAKRLFHVSHKKKSEKSI